VLGRRRLAATRKHCECCCSDCEEREQTRARLRHMRTSSMRMCTTKPR
jgi:hypothetical protein